MKNINQHRPGQFILLLALFFTVATCGTVTARGHGHGPPGQHKRTMDSHTEQDKKDIRKNGNVWIQPVPVENEEGDRGKWEDGRPPGWSHGKKKGWGDSDMPPGLAGKRDDAGNPAYNADDSMENVIPAWDKGHKRHGQKGKAKK